MPTITANGARLHFEVTGTGPETLLLAHGYLWSGWMFREQVAHFQGRYRCVTFDFRGQGHSELTSAGYDVETLTDDTAEVIETLGLAPCHFLGLSMGGFVGMRLAARRPQLIRSLMLLATSADPEPRWQRPRYRAMAFVARWLGLRPVIDPVMAVMFGPRFLHDPARAALRRECRRCLKQNRPAGIYRALHGIIFRAPIVDELHHIQVPTLILVGDRDTATVPAVARRIHERIAHSELVVLPGVGHTSTIEDPAAVNAALERFLTSMAKV